jgi:hypothetical protein
MALDTTTNNSTRIAPFSEDPVFDEVQAGIYIGGAERPVSPRTMQRWRLEGSGPEFIRLRGGRLVRYRRSALDAFLLEGQRRSTSDSTGRTGECR